jgi:hypothetical protein
MGAKFAHAARTGTSGEGSSAARARVFAFHAGCDARIDRPMSDDDVVTAVLVGASLAAPSGAQVALTLVGLLVTLFAWSALAGWCVHWGML